MNSIDPKDGLIAVAMSGGVDSSVAAALLKEQGYQIVGLTMKLWDAGKSGALNEKTCCTLDSSLDAKRVCEQLGIPHYTLDMSQDFEDRVMEPFYQAFVDGKTPNPCVNCNSFVKWDALWNHARAIGATHIATGHYAETEIVEGRRYIRRSQDKSKDQSYFLWGIPSQALQETLFPLDGLSKPEVREIAAKLNLRTAHKAESMDICFIPDGDKNRFLRERAQSKGETFNPGAIIGPEGQKLGNHQGLPFYTLGQRKGLGVAAGEPLFVQKINRETNTLILGRKDQLGAKYAQVGQLNWFEETLPQNGEYLVQMRYRSKALPCKVQFKDGIAQVELLEEATSITPGQSAVFYIDERVLGGGVIL